MEIWKIASGLLVIVWFLQAIGTFVQMRHYRSVMGAITDKWSDGHLGAGSARAKFGQGVIAIIVIDNQSIIRKAMICKGRSVFAKFSALKEWEGLELTALKNNILAQEAKTGVLKAALNAVEQIEKAQELPLKTLGVMS